jgi:hypothetical protein
MCSRRLEQARSSTAPANPKDSATPPASPAENVANPESPEEHASKATSPEEIARNDSGSMHSNLSSRSRDKKLSDLKPNIMGARVREKSLARPVVIGVIRIYFERAHGVYMW